jgi:hypothetical protein
MSELTLTAQVSPSQSQAGPEFKLPIPRSTMVFDIMRWNMEENLAGSVIFLLKRIDWRNYETGHGLDQRNAN